MSQTFGFVLLSGGIDSSTAVTFAISQLNPENIECVGIDYGQRHSRELFYAGEVAHYYGLPYSTLKILGMPKAMLTDASQEIPNVSYADLPYGISPTYVPFRNGQLLSKIAGYAQARLRDLDQQETETKDKDRSGDLSISISDNSAIIYFGAHAEDAENWAYPDCTPEFIGAMANAIYLGTYRRVRLVAPWQHMTKDEIISWGSNHDTPYRLTWSCYRGGELHCGTCPTCRARRKAFYKAQVVDPTQYA